MVQLFERRMAREVAYPPQGRRLTWGQVIEQQARRFARDVLGQDEYVCFEPR
jgi:CRISPR/Cas system-associated endonuclease Cas1